MTTFKTGKIKRKFIQFATLSGFFILFFNNCSAQPRPSLFLREDWKESASATPVTQDHIANNELILGLYGPGRDSIRKSNHDRIEYDPFYIWSGLCKGNWAVTLKKKDLNVDLSNSAKIKWRSKQSGFRNLHIILKLADGTWIISDQYEVGSKDWRIHEFNLIDINWHHLNIEEIYEGRLLNNPDLTNVEEIGFTDLMIGGQSDACSRIDWIEVYGNNVIRNKTVPINHIPFY